MVDILPERQAQILADGTGQIACEKHSLAGSVSQRACVFCGSRVVLYPIADAVHLVHGPIGCAAYTWDIRGSLSSGPQLHRLSFSTDLREKDVIYGGADKLYRSLLELIDQYQPKAAFVYSTCIVGLIGDDVEAICRRVASERGIPVLPVGCEGFRGTKKDGYKAACEAVFKLIGTAPAEQIRAISPFSINILGDFNIAGEVWIIKEYFRKIGVEVVSCITGDGRVDEIRRAHGAALNLVQCSGSMTHLAGLMEQNFGIPFHRVSYFGIEDMSDSLYATARYFGDSDVLRRTQALVKSELATLLPQLRAFRKDLDGKRAAIYVGGGFKAISLVKALRHLGMRTVLVGAQTGTKNDYERLQELCDPDTVIVDDSNPLELSRFLRQQQVDLLIGGVKERPMAYKMGVAFCDHNHERKIPLAGFEGMVHFAREVHASVMSPVWQLARPGARGTTFSTPLASVTAPAASPAQPRAFSLNVLTTAAVEGSQP
jgi:nitrogenase molybdenum-cofactor synthesis protein NifE